MFTQPAFCTRLLAQNKSVLKLTSRLKPQLQVGNNMKTPFFFKIALISLVGIMAQAQQTKKNLKDDFQTLGDNPEVVERVKNLDNQQKVRVVQNRTVSRTNRIELAADFSSLSGADSYVQTH